MVRKKVLKGGETQSDDFKLTDQPGFSQAITDISGIKQRLTELEEGFNQKIETSKRELSQSKNEYIAIFGIFASIITFLGIEVQAFNKLDSFSKLAGFSTLLVSLIVMLMLCIENILKDNDYKYYKNHMFWVAVVMFFVSMIFFYFSISHKVIFWHVNSH